MAYKLWCDTRSGIWCVMLETLATGEWTRVFSATTKDTCLSWMRDNPLIPSRFTDPAYAKAERAVARVERSIRKNAGR